MELDVAGWGGEGSFTAVVIDALKAVDAIESLRVENAPASRTGPGYSLISNELYVRFRTQTGAPATTLQALGSRLGRAEGVGEPDYADGGLLQYLRTERAAAPHRTTGVKIVELVRIYEERTSSRP